MASSPTRTVIEHMQALTAVLPTDVAFLIGDQLMTAVKSSEKTKGLGILLAFLVAIYGGTNGAASVITALNIAYEEKEKRSLFRFYLLAVSMTLGALLVALSRSPPRRRSLISSISFPRHRPRSVIAGKIVGYLMLALLAARVASALYRFGPSREDAKWKWITPGSPLRRVRVAAAHLGVRHLRQPLHQLSRELRLARSGRRALTWMYLVGLRLRVRRRAQQ